MTQTTFHAPDELIEKIDKERAADAAETGDIKTRSQWLRDAAREKLGIDYNGTQETETEATA